jgi:hypothetical protein
VGNVSSVPFFSFFPEALPCSANKAQILTPRRYRNDHLFPFVVLLFPLRFSKRKGNLLLLLSLSPIVVFCGSSCACVYEVDLTSHSPGVGSGPLTRPTKRFTKELMPRPGADDDYSIHQLLVTLKERVIYSSSSSF